MVKKETQDNLPDTGELLLDQVDDSSDKPVSIERLLEYRKRGLSYAEIGKMAGVSKQAVHQRLAPYRDAIENLPAFKEHRADLFAVQQSRLLNSLTDADIKRMAPASRVVSAGILYDKERLESGKSTTNQAIICRWIGENEDGSFSDD
jgi:predicted DNA-binding protein YlxM (UPF0122 family)